jgi:L-ascorbate metabolism protein UlaG (beta-lactamase superfamily)
VKAFAALAVPQHYATFPGIARNADDFAAELERLKVPFYEMKPGETVTYHGRVRVVRAIR